MDMLTSADGHQSSPRAERVVTLYDMAVVIGRVWRYLAIGALLGAGIGVGVALLTPRVYRAEVVAVLADDNSSNPLSKLAGQFGSLAALGGINLSAGGSARNETLALLRSKDFALRTVGQYNLMPALFVSRWDAASSRWRVSKPEDVPTQFDAWEVFDKKVRTVIEDRDRGLVTLRIELRDRKLAADLANTMVEQLNDALRRRKLQELDDSIAFLQREYEKATLLHLREVMSTVMESQVTERMLATSRKDYALRVVDPATLADVRRYVWPKPFLFVALGVVSGSMLGFVCGLLVAYRKRQ